MKTSKPKIFLLFGLILSVLYFTNDFALIDIEKTAIVVALGIDKEDDGYSVTAQIAVPQATDTASENDDAVMTAKGKTVLEAVDNIGSDTGWHPKLSFCSMIFVGRDLAADEVENIVDFFIRSDKVQNSAILAMSDTKASDLLFAKTPLDAISSFALQKIVLKNEWMVSTVGVTNLKQFAIMNYSKSKSAYMPVIRIVHDRSEGKDGASGGLAAASTGSGQGGGEKEKSQVIFDASSIAVFIEGKRVCDLSEDETSLYYLLRAPVYECFLSVNCDDKGYFLSVDTNTYSVSADTEKNIIQLSLDMTVEINDAETGTDLKTFTQKTVVDKKVLSTLKDKLTSVADGLMQKLSNADADIFMIKEYIYKYKNSDYERLKDLPLSEFGVDVNINVRSSD